MIVKTNFFLKNDLKQLHSMFHLEISCHRLSLNGSLFKEASKYKYNSISLEKSLNYEPQFERAQSTTKYFP